MIGGELAAYDPILLALVAVVFGFVANGLLEWLKAWLAERRDLSRVRKNLYLDVSKYDRVIQSASSELAQIDGENVRFIFVTDIPGNRMLELGLGQLSAIEVEEVSEFYSKLYVVCSFIHQHGDIQDPAREISYVNLPIKCKEMLEGWIADLKLQSKGAKTLLSQKFSSPVTLSLRRGDKDNKETEKAER